MERAVRGFDDTGVTHHLLYTNFRTQEHTLYGVPLHTVVTIYETQALCGWLMERRRHIDILRLKRKRQTPCPYKK
jgi:hypothetical protein